MKFICVMRQQCEGCDYTIGCGVKVVRFDAESLEAAKRVAIEKCGMEDYATGESDPSYYVDGEGELAQWKLYQIADELDMMPILEDWHVAFQIREAGEKDAEERKKYEELKRKYG